MTAALREHNIATLGRPHWDFDDGRECAAMGMFALVRLLKALEVRVCLTGCVYACVSAFLFLCMYLKLSVFP